MKKSKIIALLMTVGFLFCFNSCENFLKGSDLMEQLEKEIAYSNASSFSIRIAADNGTGTIVSGAGDKSVKVGDLVTLEFAVNDNYKFLSWIALDKDKTEIKLSDYVEFSPADKEVTVVKILKEGNILIKPVCALRPVVTDFSPKFSDGESPKDSVITVSFNSSIKIENFRFSLDEINQLKKDGIVSDADLLKDADGKYYAYKRYGSTLIYKNLEIETENEMYLDHFGIPSLTHDCKTLLIPVNYENPIELEAGKTKNISVRLKKNICNSNGYEMSKDFYFEYLVNSSMSQKVSIISNCSEEKGKIRLSNDEAVIGSEIQLIFEPAENYSFSKWIFDENLIEVEDVKSAQSYARVKKYSDSGISIGVSCKIDNELDHENPVIKAFRVGLTKESVMTEEGNHFATDGGILTATEIDSSQIIGAKENSKVWVYCEFEDNRTIAKATLKENFLQSNKGRDFNICTNVPIEIEENDGKISVLFEHTLKTVAQGIYKFGIGDVFDENNNKAETYEDEYYCAYHTFYDLASQGQILSSTYGGYSGDDDRIYIILEKDYVTKNYCLDLDVKVELGVGNKNYTYTLDYEDVKEKLDVTSPERGRYLKISEITGSNYSYQHPLFFKVTVRDGQNIEQIFETFRSGYVTKLYKAEKQYSNSYYYYEAYGDLTPIFIDDSEIAPLSYPSITTSLDKLSAPFNEFYLKDKKSDFLIEDYFKIETGPTFGGITEITIKASLAKLRDLFGNDLSIVELDLESDGITKKTGFTSLAGRTEDTLQRTCLVKEGETVEITDLKLHNMYSSNGLYTNAYWYLKNPVPSNRSNDPVSITRGWVKNNLRNGYDYYGDDPLMNELALQELDPTFQYGYVEKPVGTLKKAVCYYKPLAEIASGLESYMNYEKLNRGSRVRRPYSPLKLIEYGFLRKEEVYSWEKIDLIWNDKGIKVPLLQFPENKMMEVFIWCEAEDENGTIYDCMDGFQIRRKVVDAKYIDDFYSGFKAFLHSSGYSSYAPEKTQLYDLIFSWYVYDKSNEKWPDLPGQKSYRYDSYNGKTNANISTSDCRQKIDIDKIDSCSWARLFYTNTDAINGVGVDVVTVRQDLRKSYGKSVNFNYTVKDYIETKKGFICYFDQPTMVETFISDVNHGDDIEAWERNMYFDKLNSKLIQSTLAEPASYQINLDDIKEGQYYTVIFRYSDGTSEVTTVHQK